MNTIWEPLLCYSNQCFQITLLEGTGASQVIVCIKSSFPRHGVVSTVISNNFCSLQITGGLFMSLLEHYSQFFGLVGVRREEVPIEKGWSVFTMGI